MTTPTAPSIPFTSSHTQHSFKLLELPSPLLTLLESSNPPTLYLKTSPHAPHALLSTPSTTYRLQQKNTSNPLMILRPSTTRDDGGASVTTIATVEDTLELLPEEEEEAPVERRNKWHERFAKGRSGK